MVPRIFILQSKIVKNAIKYGNVFHTHGFKKQIKKRNVTTELVETVKYSERVL